MSYDLLPAEQKEGRLFFRLDSESEKRHGAIGYLRADFGRSGREFWTTWFDIQKDLKTYDFKNELDGVINSLRDDGQKPPFASRANLQTFCATNPAYPLTDHDVGFKIQTLNFTYTFRCTPRVGDYDVYSYAFDNCYLLPELAGKHELPEMCYSTLPSSGELILISRSKNGYSPCDFSKSDPEANRLFADTSNKIFSITRAQEAAMLAGSLFGWNVPAAKPWNYDQNGEPRLQNQPKKNDPER